MPKPEARGVNVTMTQEERERLKEVARQRGFKSVAAYLKSLAEKDSGVEFKGQWGGYRPPQKDV